MTPGDHVTRDGMPIVGDRPIVGVVVDVYDGSCLVEWPSGRRTHESNLLINPLS